MVTHSIKAASRAGKCSLSRMEKCIIRFTRPDARMSMYQKISETLTVMATMGGDQNE